MAKILIVDDDKDLLSLMSEYLGANGFQLELARNAAEARDFLGRSKYDAILSDFNMPGESGLDLLGHVASRYPGLPFILMTGSGMSVLEDEAMKMGGKGYVVKPFKLKDLLSTIDKVLSSSKQKSRAPALTALSPGMRHFRHLHRRSRLVNGES